MNFCQSQQKNMKCKLLGFAQQQLYAAPYSLGSTPKKYPSFPFQISKNCLKNFRCRAAEERQAMIILHNHVMEMTIIFNSKVLEDDDELVEEEEADGGGAEEEGFHLLL